MKEPLNKESLSKKLKIFIFISFDVIAFAFSWIMSMLLSKYAFSECFGGTAWFFIGGMALTVITNFLLGLYFKLWQYAGISEALRIFGSALVLACYTIIVSFVSKTEIRIQWALITVFLYLVLVAGSRFFIRLYVLFSESVSHERKNAPVKRVMIVGAGSAGSELLRDMYKHSNDMIPVCFIDDDVNKIGQSIGSVKIVGSTEEIKKYAYSFMVHEIIIAIPSAPKKEIKRITDLCEETKCKVMFVPGYYQMIKGEVSVSQLKDVDVNDLLGRDPIEVDIDEIVGYIESKVVLVTGGGGSIGSELCRQIASHRPKKTRDSRHLREQRIRYTAGT